jgi:hypothetical protein
MFTSKPNKDEKSQARRPRKISLVKLVNITFLHPTTGVPLPMQSLIAVTGNHISNLQTEIIKAVADDDITLREADIPIIKIRINGFQANDPGVIVNKQNPFIDIAKLTADTLITVRIPEDIYLEIQAVQKALMTQMYPMRFLQLAAAIAPNNSNTALTTVTSAVAQPSAHRPLFLQFAADEAAAVDSTTIETTLEKPASPGGSSPK